jgi:alanyl-tRNA synthetase
VNAEIRGNHEVETKLMNYKQALEAGAMALFGEKYGDEVRVLRMGGFSVELCGGTHAARTGDIGFFKIVAESGVAAGVRRIEGTTGATAVEAAQAAEQNLRRVAGLVKGTPADLESKVQQLVERSRQQDKELQALKQKLATQSGRDLADSAVQVGDVKVLAEIIEGADAAALRDAMDKLKDRLPRAAIVLATVEDGKVRLVAGVTKDLTGKLHAGNLAGFVAGQVGGKGGGRPDMAQAGGTDAAALPTALASVPGWVAEQLG